MNNNDDDGWRSVMIFMQRDDEKCLETVMEEILEQVNIGEKDFQAALELYLADEQKQPLIRTALQDAQVDRGEGHKPGEWKERTEPSMSKKEVMAAQQKLMDLSLKQI